MLRLKVPLLGPDSELQRLSDRMTQPLSRKARGSLSWSEVRSMATLGII